MVKIAKKSGGSEPTLTDVVGLVQNLAVSVQDLTEAVQTGFAKVDDRFDRVESRLDKVENRLNRVEGGINDVGYRVTALEKRTGSLEIAVEDMNETLNGVARAVDKDAVAILDHERRIRHPEKASV